VQGLEEQRADAADEHGPEVGVHLSGDTVGVEEGGSGSSRRRGLTAQAMARRMSSAMSAPDGPASGPSSRHGASASWVPSAVAPAAWVLAPWPHPNP